MKDFLVLLFPLAPRKTSDFVGGEKWEVAAEDDGEAKTIYQDINDTLDFIMRIY